MGLIKNVSDVGNSITSVIGSTAKVVVSFTEGAEALGTNASEYATHNLVLSRMERVAEFKDQVSDLKVTKKDRDDYKSALSEWL